MVIRTQADLNNRIAEIERDELDRNRRLVTELLEKLSSEGDDTLKKIAQDRYNEASLREDNPEIDWRYTNIIFWVIRGGGDLPTVDQVLENRDEWSAIEGRAISRMLRRA